MKLSWKIVLVVLLIVTLTVSISSYVMIAAAFQAELDSQAGAAADESTGRMGESCGKTGRNQPISPPQMWDRRACVMGSSKRRRVKAGIWKPSSAWS